MTLYSAYKKQLSISSNIDCPEVPSVAGNVYETP
jgi:hypothetical protein